MTTTPPLPGPPLRIAVLGDFDGPHTRRWLRVFVERGHDVHAISFYRPRAGLPGVTVHVLSDRKKDPAPASERPGDGRASVEDPSQSHAAQREEIGVARPRSPAHKLPVDALRLVHAWRYRSAGLRDVLRTIEPHVFHAHYVVEHGFYGAVAGFHPYVVSAWGSDLLVESRKPLARRLARYALGRADLVTVQDPSMTARAIELGAPAEKVHVVRLGIDALFFDDNERSVNVREDTGPPTIVSDRALEPLYNIDVILRAFARVRAEMPSARLVVAHDGSECARLVALSRDLGLSEAVRFTGRLTPAELHETLLAAHVYVSVPRSDAFALSTMEAMASGAFPVVSDLPSVEGMIRHGENGLRARVGDLEDLAGALRRALGDRELRRSAVEMNRSLVASEGRLETNMLAMERHYYRLAGHPVGGAEAI